MAMLITINDSGKIYEFEVPEWATEKRLVLLAGIELVASKVPWDSYWEVKKDRCNMCGQCCMTFKPDSNQTPYGVDDEGKCIALKKEGSKWICSVGAKIPYNCVLDPIDELECVITKVKVEAQ